MTLRTLDQRVDTIEEGLKEMRSSLAELQQQINTQLSPLIEKMTEMATERNKLHSTLKGMNCSTISKETIQGSGVKLQPSPPPSLSFENSSVAAILNRGDPDPILRELQMPLFDGNNSMGWILEIERCFSFYRLREEDWLEVAVMTLEGDALLWYEWEHRRRAIRDWEELKGLIRRQYISSMVGVLHELHTKMFQVWKKTERKTAPLTEVTEEGFLGQCEDGLKKEEWAENGVGSLDLNPAIEVDEEKLSPHVSKSPITTLEPQSAMISVNHVSASPRPTYISIQTFSTNSDSTISTINGGKSKVATKNADSKITAKEIVPNAKVAKNPNKTTIPESAIMDMFKMQYKDEHPNNKPVVVRKARGTNWKSMSEFEKAPYVAKTNKRKKGDKKLNPPKFSFVSPLPISAQAIMSPSKVIKDEFTSHSKVDAKKLNGNNFEFTSVGDVSNQKPVNRPPSLPPLPPLSSSPPLLPSPSTLPPPQSPPVTFCEMTTKKKRGNSGSYSKRA
ncbi:hypothetical protein L1887_09596 [Cichorium endivia]|nr:hypothetical protein L1887_09596 [Cichorium endivia]